MLKRPAALVLAAALSFVGLALAAAPANAHPAGCAQHVINPTQQIAQGPSPDKGINSWRLTGFLNLTNDSCDGIYMSNASNCGWFFVSRVTPSALDWSPASVCTGEIFIAHRGSIVPGDLFAIYQGAGAPYSGAHAASFTLWY